MWRGASALLLINVVPTIPGVAARSSAGSIIQCIRCPDVMSDSVVSAMYVFKYEETAGRRVTHVASGPVERDGSHIRAVLNSGLAPAGIPGAGVPAATDCHARRISGGFEAVDGKRRAEKPSLHGIAADAGNKIEL